MDGLVGAMAFLFGILGLIVGGELGAIAGLGVGLLLVLAFNGDAQATLGLSFAGLVIGAPALRNLIAMATLVVAQAIRMRLEERALEDAFSEYAAYAARTPRLFPWPRHARLSSAARGGTRPMET